jgi:hypothetical protein
VVTGKWRKLPSEELSDLYISPNIFRVIKPKRKNYIFVYTIAGRRNVNIVWWGIPRGRDQLVDSYFYGSVISF